MTNSVLELRSLHHLIVGENTFTHDKAGIWSKLEEKYAGCSRCEGYRLCDVWPLGSREMPMNSKDEHWNVE